MIYEYKCDSCDNSFIENLSIANREQPVGKPCECCEEGTVQRDYGSVSFHYLGTPNSYALNKAGDGWSDVLKEIKKGCGKGDTIVTK